MTSNYETKKQTNFTETPSANRSHKDSLFRMLFKEPTELLERCPTLCGYMHLVNKIRTYQVDMDKNAAVGRAVDECIEEDVLKEFLMRNKAEAVAMCIFEYNEELHEKTLLEIGEERGEKRGIEIGEKRGIEVGEKRGEEQILRTMLANGMSIDELAKFLNKDETEIKEMLE